MEEQQLLSEHGVQVTTARLVAGGQTYALRNITSVRMTAGGSMTWAVLWIAFAVLLLAGTVTSGQGQEGGVLAFIVFGTLGAGLWWRARTRRIVVHSSGSDQVAYSTRDRAHAERILQALNDAIGRR